MKKLYFLLSLMIFTFSLNAKTIYVSTTGNDVSGNGTKINPYKTICRADTLVTANNDTVMLAPGTYTAAVTSRLKPFNQFICGESAANTIIDFTGINIGVFLDEGDVTLTIKNITLQNGGNTTDEGGGAIWMHKLTNLVLENVILTDNTTNRVGGAIVFYGKSLKINNCLFSNNHVLDTGTGNWSYGGAMFIQGIDNNVNVNIQNSTFSNNSSDVFGGAITFWKISGVDADNILIKNCNFYQNKALSTAYDWTGGAINFQSLPTAQINATLVNNTFYENVSGNGATPTTLLAQGAKTYLTLVNNVITNSSGNGVTLFVLDGSAPFTKGKNNIIRSVNAEVMTSDFYTILENYNYLDPSSSMVTGVKIANSLTDNSTVDIFKVPFLATLSGSTTINAGAATYATPNIVPLTDITGAAAVGIKDIGAYEFGGLSALKGTLNSDDISVFVKNKVIHINTKEYDNVSISVYNVSGVCLKSLQSKNSTSTINMTDAGLYFVKVDVKVKCYSQKVIVI